MRDDPLVIGGTGGSGTRAVARILLRAGHFMGSRLNRSEDALDMSEFDWRWGVPFLRSGATEAMRLDFERALDALLERRRDPAAPWGWKHPHSYLLLPFLAERFPGLRFIHVVRDGRDIVLARNQNQVRHYGEVALGPGDPDDAVRRIMFWAWANARAADQASELLGDRVLRVRLEDLCDRTASEVRRVLRFAGADGDDLPVEEVVRPASLGRGLRIDPDLRARLEAAGGAALRRFGYLGPSGP